MGTLSPEPPRSAADRSRRLIRPASRRPAKSGAFTLVEMLVVVALVSILMTLVAPSLQGLFGVAGRRGGANALSTALEQARLAAVENGVAAYVGFATASTNRDAAFNSVIVFRAKRDDETGPDFVPLSRWVRLPTGVFIDPASISGAATSTVSPAGGAMPRLGSESLSSVPVLEFDRFGRLRSPTGANAVLRVGEGVVAGSGVTFRPNANSHYALTILPLTGRVQITDAARP